MALKFADCHLATRDELKSLPTGGKTNLLCAKGTTIKISDFESLEFYAREWSNGERSGVQFGWKVKINGTFQFIDWKQFINKHKQKTMSNGNVRHIEINDALCNEDASPKDVKTALEKLPKNTVLTYKVSTTLLIQERGADYEWSIGAFGKK